MTNAQRLWTSLRKTFVKQEDHRASSSHSRTEAQHSANSLSTTKKPAAEDNNSISCDADLRNEIYDSVQYRLQQRRRLLEQYVRKVDPQPILATYDVFDVPDPDKFAMTVAMDALCIAQIVTATDEAQAGQAGEMVLGKAIEALGWWIGVFCQTRPKYSLLEEIIGALHALLLYAWFACIDGSSVSYGTSYYELKSIVRKLEDIVREYEWESVSSSVKRAFRCDWQRRVLCICMATRRRAPPGLLRTLSNIQRSNSFLRECAFEVPQLLERTDLLLARSEIDSAICEGDVVDLVTALGQSVALLKRYHLHWASVLPPLYSILSLRTFENFGSMIGQCGSLFRTAYKFHDLTFETDFRISYLCLLEIDQAILRIHEAYPDVCAATEYQLQLVVTKEDANAAAETLCMLLPWYVKEGHGALGCICALMPLYYAARYFYREMYEERLAWCSQVSRLLCRRYAASVE